MCLLLFPFLLKLNEVYISFLLKWTKAHTEWVRIVHTVANTTIKTKLPFNNQLEQIRKSV